MYLLIFESGIVKKINRIPEEWFSGVDDGYVDIIDISNPEKPLWYYQDGRWSEVESL